MDDLRPSRIVHAALRQRESLREPRLERVLSGGLPFYLLLPHPYSPPSYIPLYMPEPEGGETLLWYRAKDKPHLSLLGGARQTRLIRCR